MSNLKEVVAENFSRYAGNVILDRAICDVRDMLKPSARMLTYSQVHITKNIPSKPFVKSARVVGDCLGHYYTHGDGSCYGTYMRMAKPFAMRYPLEDCQGNCGTVTVTGDEAAARYTELRLSKLGYQLFNGIEQDTIKDWYDNFDETDTFPKILPTKGFYNIVNGSTGIGVSLSASIPQFNIKDINNALINLIDDSNYELDILPDFATGGILINPNQVKESLKFGYGDACKLRSVVEFDQKQRAFLIKELPYGVYTSTISEEIKNLVEKESNCGIDGINDGSGKTPDYLIYLTKKANPDKVLKLLYKETSLQSYFTINMTVLTDDGKIPKVLGLKEMLQAHIDHEKEVYRRGFEFDLRKIENRIHIINGLLICMASIDEVVKLIKASKSTADAAAALKSNFLLDDAQAKAVLDMKLSKLAHLEVEKLENEKESLQKEADRINTILNDEVLFNNELKNGWREVAEKFGDERRTKIINLAEGDSDEPIEVKQLTISFTNNAAVFGTESSTLYTQKRNGVGNKFKLDKGEYVIDNLVCDNIDTLLFFSKSGKFYHYKASEFTVGEKQYIPYSDKNIIAATVLNKNKKNIIFITKKGIIKKSLLSEYNLKRNTENGSLALKLDEGDEIASILFTDDEKIGVLSNQGYFIMLDSSLINPIGRVTRGIAGMKLNIGDKVAAAKVIKDSDKEIVSITVDGYCKKTKLNEFRVTGRNTKGVKVHKDENLVDFILVNDSNDLLVVSNTSQIRIKYNDIPLLGRGTQGVKVLKLTENSKIVKIEQF